MSGYDHTHNPERQRAGYRTPVHHVHSLVPGSVAGGAAMAGDSRPERYIGTWGSMSIDTINQLTRFHDDVSPGGAAVGPIFSQESVFAPMWPFIPLQWNPVDFTAGQTKEFVAPYGRFPMVMAIDAATGMQVQVAIQYTIVDGNYGGMFSVTSAVDATLIIISQ